MVKAIIFDLDDTLISEKKYIESGYFYVSKLLSEKYHVEQKDIYETLKSLSEENPKNVFNRFFDYLNVSYSYSNITELVEEYRNHTPKIKFYEDVLPCLNSLKKKGIQTGIITDGYSEAQRKKVASVEAYKYIDKSIITDELGREFWKPHPKAFEILKNFFDVKFEEIVYVGDNPEKDFYIGEVYPIKTVRIFRKNGVHSSKPYYKNIKAKYNIHSLYELEEALGI